MSSHEIDYKISGQDMQVVEIELDSGESVVAEAGAMVYMESSIQMETCLGDGSEKNSGFMGKLMGAGKRLLTGESMFMTHFTHKGTAGKQHVAFAAPYPGKIIALDLSAYDGNVLCQKDSFLCGAKGISISVAFTQKLGAGFFGGEGFVLQKIEGDGKAFIHAGGAIIKKELQPGELLRVDTGCLVALTQNVQYNIEMVKGIKSALFGGEGLFFATLTGPGTAWLQSVPFSRMAEKIVKAAPQKKEEG